MAEDTMTCPEFWRRYWEWHEVIFGKSPMTEEILEEIYSVRPRMVGHLERCIACSAKMKARIQVPGVS